MEMQRMRVKKMLGRDNVTSRWSIRYHYDHPELKGFQFSVEVYPTECDFADEQAVISFADRRAMGVVSEWVGNNGTRLVEERQAKFEGKAGTVK